MMMDITGVVKNVYVLANAIYKCVKQVKVNRVQCQRLSGRIRVIVDAIEDLEQLPESSKFNRGIENLEKGLKESLQFVQNFTEQKRWWIQALKYESNDQQFATLNEVLQHALADLNLSIQVKQIANHEQDNQDRKADTAEIKAQQNKILSCYQQNRQEFKVLKSALDQREQLMARQLSSIKRQLRKIAPNEDKVFKPLLPPDLEIPFFELTLGEIIGQGSIATVYAGEWNSQPVAIKCLPTSLSGQEGVEFVREAQILSRLRSPFIVSFYGACLEEGHACLVMEYLPYSLADYLEKNPLSRIQQKQIALKMMQGLHYLHKKDLCHGDLRSANILLTKDYHVKITDFGLTQTRAFTIQSLHKISPAIAWCAPELLSEAKMTAKSDIYSLGTLLWEVFTGKKPFANMTLEEQMKAISLGKREVIGDEIPGEWKKAITACWSSNPDERPTLSEVMALIEAFNPIADLYRQGKRAEQDGDHKAAVQHYRSASELDCAAAFTSLAMLMLAGKGVTRDKVQAFQLLLTAANKGHRRAMKNAAIVLDRGDGIVKDQHQALFWYRKAAAEGDQEALKRAQYLEKKLSH